MSGSGVESHNEREASTTHTLCSANVATSHQLDRKAIGESTCSCEEPFAVSSWLLVDEKDFVRKSLRGENGKTWAVICKLQQRLSTDTT